MGQEEESEMTGIVRKGVYVLGEQTVDIDGKTVFISRKVRQLQIGFPTWVKGRQAGENL